MTTTLEGLPEALARADLSDSCVTLTVDQSVYPVEALYGAAYVFIDRCYVVVDRPDSARFLVTLSAKAPGATADALRGLAGDFANELLSCAWRHRITTDNRAVIEAVTRQAIAGAMGPPTLEDLASFDFTEEAFDDPLGIAVSWEDKYGKKKTDAGGGAEPAAGPAPAAPAAKPTGEGGTR